MKKFMPFLLMVCAAVSACIPAGPSGEQIQAALDKEVKKGNPDATAKLTDIEMEKNGKTTKFKFDCTNCLLEDGSRTKKIVPIAKGSGAVWFSPVDKRWEFDGVLIDNEDGTKETLSFDDHVF